MESRSPHEFPLQLWPALWIPLVILLCGLAATALIARTEAAQARALAEARYEVQHQILVSRLLANAPTYLESESPPTSWLPILFGDSLPDELGLRIDTLERHSKLPLLQLQAGNGFDPTTALRTEIQPGENHWMLTTVPAPSSMNQTIREAKISAWLWGLVLTLIATGLALFQCRRLHSQRLQMLALERRETGADQQITNLEVEKGILHQALEDSEERTRDLIQLSGALIGELDDNGIISFISGQSAEWFGRAPADLAGHGFEELIESKFRENFRLTLNAARKSSHAQRIDLRLLGSDHHAPLPVVLRIRAVKDPIHGVTGYRLSATPDHGLSD